MITKAQRVALSNLFARANPPPTHPINKREWLRRYRAFRRTAFVMFGDCLMVKWCGMTVGIERDGHTHT